MPRRLAASPPVYVTMPRRPVHLLFLPVYLLAGLAGSQSPPPDNQLTITGVGATFPGEVFEAWTASFESNRNRFRNIDMKYSAAGSSVGKLVLQQDPSDDVTDDSDDVTYGATDSEMTALEYLNNPDLQMVPILAGPVVMAFNLPFVDTTINLTRAHIVGIYNGTYRFWNETSIRLINPNATFPDRPIRVVARADYSGTTEIFTASLSNFDPDWNRTYGKFPDGLNSQDDPVHWNASVIDLYGRLNRGVSGIILSYRYSIGYMSIADAVVSEMTLVRIWDDAYGVLRPSFLDVRRAMDRSVPMFDNQLTADLNDFVQPDEYPIIGYSYLIVRRTGMRNCDRAVELVRYIEWSFTDTFSTEQIVDFRMSSVTSAVAKRIEEDVLRVMECDGGRSVWQLVQQQKDAEYLSTLKWRIPVFVTVPIAGAGILAMIIYIIVQQIRLRRALLSDEWNVPETDIQMSWNKQNGFVGDKYGPGSMISLNMSMTSNSSMLVALHVWGVGVWGEKLVCLREQPDHAAFNTSVKETRKTLLWMKYKVVHTNVLRLFGVVQIEPDVYMLSEHAQKGTLSDVVQNEKYRIDDNIKFALAGDLASGMGFLHGMGVVHGSLSSESCLIDQRWNIKIADWEYTMLEESSKKGPRKPSSKVSPVFTRKDVDFSDNSTYRRLFFSDPLVLQNPTVARAKNMDVYSGAIVIVEIFSRDDPFTELTGIMEPKDIVEAIKVKDIRPLITGLSPTSIQPIIKSAWASDPYKRPTFAAVTKSLKAAKPSKKSVMDSMMEVLEGYVNHLEEKVSERTAELAAVNSSLENLLHQILPPSVATSLSRGDTVEPESFESVTIFFSDIVGFTALSSSSTPMEVVNMLNDLYTTFDAIMDLHDVYKVETIGDAYMVISGLPNRNGHQHASHICTMALDLMAAASKFVIRHKPDDRLSLRAGVHTGPVVAGVVGLKMPRYCLFGDTVNTASRMESTSTAGRVQVSQTTTRLLDVIGGFKTELRGEVQVKGKGSMQTFFLLVREGYTPLSAPPPTAHALSPPGGALTSPRAVSVYPKVSTTNLRERAPSVRHSKG